MLLCDLRLLARLDKHKLGGLYNFARQPTFSVILVQNNFLKFPRSRSKTFSSWESKLDASKCSYTALYPRSWSEFDLSEYGIKLICRQISPIIPHNYKDSSLPCAVFVWQVENVGDEERKVSISFVMKNGSGNKKQDAAGAPKSSVFTNEDLEGVSITQTIAGMPCNYSIGVYKTDKNSVSKVAKIDPNGNGAAIWNDLTENGILTEKSEDKNVKDGKDVCVAICCSALLKPSECDEFEFGFVWDAPKVKFPKSTTVYSKYYTKYFDDDANAGVKILDYALKNYSHWESAIAEWQKDVLEDE